MLGGGLIANWAVNVYRGYVILVIFGHTIRGTYIIRDVAVPGDHGENAPEFYLNMCKQLGRSHQ